jgi:hypothetical protein
MMEESTRQRSVQVQGTQGAVAPEEKKRRTWNSTKTRSKYLIPVLLDTWYVSSSAEYSFSCVFFPVLYLVPLLLRQ